MIETVTKLFDRSKVLAGPLASWRQTGSPVTTTVFTGTDLGLHFCRFWVRGLPFPNARHLGDPFQWKNTLAWHLGRAAKVRILRFKNLPPLRHDRGPQNHV
jgi:hypothetical protein